MILLSPPDVGADERTALLRAFDSGWIAPLGPEVDAFEAELADYVGAPAAAVLSSGTAALHLALVSLGIEPGDEVVVQSSTFAATAFAVVHAGAVRSSVTSNPRRGTSTRTCSTSCSTPGSAQDPPGPPEPIRR